jgi:hypothetical protein
MAKKTAKKSGRKRTPSRKKAGARARAASRRRRASTVRKTGRRAGAKTARRKTSRKASARTRKTAAKSRKTAAKGRKRATATKARRRPRLGGTGTERELAQTPQAGRSVQGPTNPMRTRRSTGTPAGAGGLTNAPGLARSRRRLREVEEHVPTPPSSLDMDRNPSAARTGRQEMREAREEHNETSPVLTGGDVDADWEDAYSVGDEAPGGDNPTPDQDRVDDIGRALGVQYQDNEELRSSDKIADRDRHRWELDPASSEDYRDRDRE